MAHGRPGLDPLRTTRPRTVEIATSGFDPDRAGVGSGPLGADVSNGVLFVPQFVPQSGDRFLFRLAAVHVPAGYYGTVLDVAQLLTIAQQFDVTVGQDSWRFPIEREVVSPTWSFSDGNVLWALTFEGMAGLPSAYPGPVTPPQPSVSNDLYGNTGALLAETTVTAPTYRAPGRGIIPGDPIAGLGHVYDLRFPWNLGNTLGQRYTVYGPGQIVLWASVKQTDPETRPYIPQASLPASLAGWRPEDQFLYSFGDPPAQPGGAGNRVRYRHIGGRVQVEIGLQEFLCKDEAINDNHEAPR